jgi:hypothetical protein
MNKISFIILSLALSVAISSCRFEDDDYFDEPAAQRIETTTNDIKKTLVDAENGWVMQYFTGTDDIEGFNLFARFDNSNKVTMAGDHRYLRNDQAGKYTEYVSLYDILKEDGPVLAFNTWNDILTPFVDPVDPSAAPKNLVKDGEGMKGDHNFVVLSYNSGEVKLRGERHNAEVRLVPCNGSWEEYIAATNKLKDYFATSVISNYYVTNGTDTLYFKGLRNGTFTYCERISDPLFPTTVNCVFTPQGFRLHHENDIKGTKFQEFHMAADSTCLVSENDSVRVIALWDSYVVNHAALWPVNPESLTANQKQIMEQIDAAVKGFSNSYGLESINIGRSSGSDNVYGLVLRFYTNTAQTKFTTAGMALGISRPAFGRMTITLAPDASIDKNFKNLVNKLGDEFRALVYSLAQTLVGEYDIVPDNYFQPTGATLNSTDGTKSIKLQ